MKKLALFLMAAAFCFVAAGSAFAMDLNPPPWRGEYSTTVQGWRFNSSQRSDVRPDWGAFLPSTELDVGGVWLSIDEGMAGVWSLSGPIDVIVDNHDPIPENEKWIWIQLTWRPQTIGMIPTINVTDPDGVTVGPLDPIEEVSVEGPWIHSTYFVELPWNPPWESIKITGTVINVDQLVIDTWCVPEPSTLLMLGGGLIGLAAIVRKKK